MSDQESRADSKSDSAIQQMLSFIKEDLWGMTKRYFMDPISGVQALSKDSSSAASLRAMTLMLLAALIFYLGIYIMLGDLSEQMEPIAHLFLLAVPITFMLVMASISFVIKKVATSEGDFKQELTTGALFAFPIVFALVVVYALVGEVRSPAYLTRATNDSWVFSALLMYAFLMMVNTIMQSMKASNVSERLSWYVSPAAVVLGFYLSAEILTAAM